MFCPFAKRVAARAQRNEAHPQRSAALAQRNAAHAQKPTTATLVTPLSCTDTLEGITCGNTAPCSTCAAPATLTISKLSSTRGSHAGRVSIVRRHSRWPTTCGCTTLHCRTPYGPLLPLSRGAHSAQATTGTLAGQVIPAGHWDEVEFTGRSLASPATPGGRTIFGPSKLMALTTSWGPKGACNYVRTRCLGSDRAPTPELWEDPGPNTHTAATIRKEVLTPPHTPTPPQKKGVPRCGGGGGMVVKIQKKLGDHFWS